MPRLACVIVSYNTPPELREATQSIIQQDIPIEIIVVNSGHGDPAQLLQEFSKQIRIVNHPERLFVGAARNIGIRASKAPYVSFLASDCKAAHGWGEKRVEYHESGAMGVSSAIQNSHRFNCWSVATQLLLFSRRLEGTPNAFWLQFGVSYRRTVFDEVGYFDETLRTGEDSEFNHRMERLITNTKGATAAIKAYIIRGRDITTIHKNPTCRKEFLDQLFRRGSNMVRAYHDFEQSNRVKWEMEYASKIFANTAMVYFRSAPLLEKIIGLLYFPFALSGRRAYLAGVRDQLSEYKQGISEDSGDSLKNQKSSSPPTIFGLLQVRDGMRYLPGFFENLSGKLDGIIALDDGSTDGTAEYLASHPGVISVIRNPPLDPHVWDERKNTRKLIQTAQKLDCTWVLAIDVDERLPDDFLYKARRAINHGNDQEISAYYVWLKELWSSVGQYRVDGIWGGRKAARLFRVEQDMDFDDASLHGDWVPLSSCIDNDFVESDLSIYHLSMIQCGDPVLRLQKCKSLYPGVKWQQPGYESLIDESGLILRDLPKDSRISPSPTENLVDKAPKLYALLVAYNEENYIPEFLQNVMPHVDGLIALDDGSSDNTAALLENHPKLLRLIRVPQRDPHEWDECENQRLIIEAASEFKPEWLIVIDADERLEQDFRKRLIPLIHAADTKGISVLAYKFRELWDDPNYYRSDGIWGEKTKANIFKYRADHLHDPRLLHNYWAPLNSIEESGIGKVDLDVYHLRMLHAQDRHKRHERYMQLDPESQWQPIGYEYLIDETDIQLSEIEGHRHFIGKKAHNGFYVV